MINETLSTLVKQYKDAEFSGKQCVAWNAKARLFYRCAIAESSEFLEICNLDDLFSLPPEDSVMIFRIGHLRDFDDIAVSKCYVWFFYLYYGEDPEVEAELDQLRAVIPYPDWLPGGNVYEAPSS